MTGRFKFMAGTVLLGLLVLSLTVSPILARDSSRSRWLKIRVYQNGSSTPNVLVNLPMSVVTAFLHIAARADARASLDVPDSSCEKTHVRVKDIDLEEVIQELETMDPGQIVEVQHDDQRVSIWIE